MPRPTIPTYRLALVAGIALLGACAQTPPPPAVVASNPPPVAPGPGATWYHVSFDTDSYAIDAKGQQVIDALMAELQRNPAEVATIIGRTDTVGSAAYNMHLSHQRADAVRDALVYKGNVAAARVETRWTGEKRPGTAPGPEVADAANRVVDIALH